MKAQAQAQSPFSGDCKTKEWDPHTTLGIINPDQGTFTCVGYAPSKHRRCRNPIARAGRDFVYELLELLALISTSTRSSHEFAILLQEAACRSLCWRHDNQVASVVEQWGASISAEDRKQCKSRLKTSQTTGSHYYTRYTDEDTKTKTDDRKQKEQAEQEYQRREQERERERKKKQKEQEQREKEEARERRRRKAQQQHEEREREREWRARDQAVKMKERRDWQQAWQSYATKWAAFREAKHEPSTPQQAQLLIPWPVKSGRFYDVKVSDVKTFYREACPTAGTPAMFKTMQGESLKWHPDKMRMLYRTCTPGDADKLVIEMICRVVLELREEAKAMRSG